jgi:hypothetical protein
MTFCRNCGAQLEGNEKFCVKCGTPVEANGPATAPHGPVAAAQAPVAPVIAAAPPPAYPVAVMQPQPVAGSYASFGGPPVTVALPQAQPMKHSWATTVIVLVVLAAGGYYYQKHQAAPAAPQPGTAPTQPATAPPPGTGPSQPGIAPSAPGGNQGTQQQAFAGHWQVVNGYILISNGIWKNNANVAMQSAVLECDQFNLGGTDLAQMQTTLNGPVQPGGTATFNPFQMGGAVMNMHSVNCTIMSVTPAN